MIGDFLQHSHALSMGTLCLPFTLHKSFPLPPHIREMPLSTLHYPHFVKSYTIHSLAHYFSLLLYYAILPLPLIYFLSHLCAQLRSHIRLHNKSRQEFSWSCAPTLHKGFGPYSHHSLL